MVFGVPAFQVRDTIQEGLSTSREDRADVLEPGPCWARFLSIIRGEISTEKTKVSSQQFLKRLFKCGLWQCADGLMTNCSIFNIQNRWYA